MSQPDEATDAAPPKKSKKMLFIILGAVVLLGAGGAGAWFFTQGGKHPEQAEEAPPKTPIFLPLETFTVNLQSGDQYLQTDITLQATDQADIDAVKLHMPRIRSRLLALLSSKHSDQLISVEDKKKLTQEILAAVNQPFYPKAKPQKIEDVLFTTFVIQ